MYGRGDLESDWRELLGPFGTVRGSETKKVLEMSQKYAARPDQESFRIRTVVLLRRDCKTNNVGCPSMDLNRAYAGQERGSFFTDRRRVSFHRFWLMYFVRVGCSRSLASYTVIWMVEETVESSYVS